MMIDDYDGDLGYLQLVTEYELVTANGECIVASANDDNDDNYDGEDNGPRTMVIVILDISSVGHGVRAGDSKW